MGPEVLFDYQPVLKGELIEDDTRVVYFTDGAGGTADQFDPSYDTLFYDIVLGQDGSGEYTFTVYEDPPPAVLEFGFDDLPSGQNLHGTIADDKTDPDGFGLLLFPKGAELDADGEMTNQSETTNTSKGGGPVTIGNTNHTGRAKFSVDITDIFDFVPSSRGTGSSVRRNRNDVSSKSSTVRNQP